MPGMARTQVPITNDSYKLIIIKLILGQLVPACFITAGLHARIYKVHYPILTLVSNLLFCYLILKTDVTIIFNNNNNFLQNIHPMNFT